MFNNAGLIASLIHRLVDLFVNEDQLPERLKRREGDKLEAAFHAAYREWRRAPTAENRRKRDEALATLRRWADAA
jgi:hypothetical protein